MTELPDNAVPGVALTGPLIDRLLTARAITAFTGAGISAESGVPTFRGEDGLWRKFRPEELANFDAFMRNPELVWEWYRHRKHLTAGVRPNPGHYALAELEQLCPTVRVITQNIDNLHRRAGSTVVHELHGNIERNSCTGCGKILLDADIPMHGGAPRCPSCGGLVRPDVVWFGELLPAAEWEASVRAAEMADLFLAIGTSAVVYPAASLPAVARRAGAFVVEINIEPTEFSRTADEVIIGKSGVVLPALVARLRAAREQKPNP